MAEPLLAIYEDSNCTDELTVNGDTYDMVLGPLSGLDGDSGDISLTHLYLLNKGDKGALHTKILKTNDVMNQVSFSANGIDYVDDNLSLGDINPAAHTEFYVRVLVPKGTESSLYTPSFTISYDSPV